MLERADTAEAIGLNQRASALLDQSHEPFDRLIGATEADFADQVLVNPLSAQPSVQLALNSLAMHLTETGAASFGPSGRFGASVCSRQSGVMFWRRGGAFSVFLIVRF
jgi:hypothetical protein